MAPETTQANNAIGRHVWVIPEGYLPAWSQGPEPELTSHGSLSILNANNEDARPIITLFFADRDPVGPYDIVVPARRTRHVRFNELEDPEPVPTATDFSSVVESDVPVVVQHTRLDSRQAANAIMTTLGWAAP